MQKSTIECSDALLWLREQPTCSIQCCVTSPPYFSLRDYGVPGQLGLEATPEEYVAKMVELFGELRRVLREDGTLWLNLGDSYAANAATRAGKAGFESARGSETPTLNTAKQGRLAYRGGGIKSKDLIGIPWRVAFALQQEGWYLRQDIIWAKPNPMPESCRDRCTKSHEYLFLLTKSPRYYFDNVAIKEPATCAGAPSERKTAGKAFREAHAGHGDGMRTQPTGRTCGYPSFRNRRSAWWGDDEATAECKKVIESTVLSTAEKWGTLRAIWDGSRLDVWKVTPKPFKQAHFATFPPDLVRPCLLAGTSQHGCCSSCAAPWKRITERVRRSTRPGTDSKVYVPDPELKQDALGNSTHVGFNARWRDAQEIGNRDPERHVTETKTAGWEATCRCGAEVIPCVVADIFSGAGTVALVAKELGRSFRGCELNPDYVSMSVARVAA